MYIYIYIYIYLSIHLSIYLSIYLYVDIVINYHGTQVRFTACNLACQTLNPFAPRRLVVTFGRKAHHYELQSSINLFQQTNYSTMLAR